MGFSIIQNMLFSLQSHQYPNNNIFHVFFFISAFTADYASSYDHIHFRKGIKGPKLILNGFSYFKNNSSNDRTYWLCSRNRYGRCKARIITMNDTREVLVKNTEHNHNRDPIKDINSLEILPMDEVLESLRHAARRVERPEVIRKKND